MAQTSMPWDYEFPFGDAGVEPYSGSEWDLINRCLFASGSNCGVIAGVNGELAVGTLAGNLTVEAGAALIYGKLIRSSAVETLVIPTPIIATRIDLICLRCCWVSSGICANTLHPGSGEVCGPKKIRICLKQGVEGGAAPILTQTPDIVYEIPLAYATITTGAAITIADARYFIGNSPAFDRYFSANEINPDSINGPDPDPVYGWLFDPTTEEYAYLNFRLPESYESKRFRIWLYWDTPMAGISDQVSWIVSFMFVQPGELDAGGMAGRSLDAVQSTILYGAGRLLISEFLIVLGGTVDPLSVANRTDWVMCTISRDATGIYQTDDYAHDARLLGMRFHLF